MFSKIVSRRTLPALVKKSKARGKTVVTANGSFDILHPGHMELLRTAKSKGDVLIVLLNSDKSIRLYKGPGRPINSGKARVEVLSAIKYVDHIVFFDEINPKKILGEIKPDIHVNGSDWGKNCIEREVIERYGGKISLIKLKRGHSSSKLIPDNSARAVFLDRDGVINKRIIRGYVQKTREFIFLPKVMDAFRKLSKTGYKIIIITNQSGVGKGLFTRRDLNLVHAHMLNVLRSRGARVDKIYVCPHAPDSQCPCRKPKIGMILDAARDFKLNLSKSWMVGDHDTDIIMGREANLRTVKVDGRMQKTLKLEPNYYAKDLEEAVKIILNENHGQK